MISGLISQAVRRNSTYATTYAAKIAKVLPSLEEVGAKDIEQSSPRGTYFLERSKYGNLPIYKIYRSQAVYTEVTKVQGDIVQLKNDIEALLPEIKKKDFICNMQSRTIRIKKDVSQKLKELLEPRV